MFQIINNSLSGACLYLLIALSFWLIYAPTKTFYMTHAAAITFGAYVSFWINRQFNLPLLYASLIAIITVGTFFSAIEKGLFQKLRCGTKGWVGLVASIGLYVVLQNLIALIFGDETMVFTSNLAASDEQYWGVYVADTQIVLVGVSGFLSLGAIALLSVTRLGRSIRGVADNPELCELLGINVGWITCFSVGIGSAIAAAGGVLSGLDSEMTPTMGFRLMLNGVIVMIISGGEGFINFLGAALILSTTQHVSAFFLNAKWMDAVAFAILITFLIWKPLGINGRRLRKIEV